MGKVALKRLSFAEKFEQALETKKGAEPGWGLKTLARTMGKGDAKRTETLRRQLNKYRPQRNGPPPITPTEPTRHEIEAAMGLERDALKPDGEDEEEDPVSRYRRLRAELVLLGREDLAEDLRSIASAQEIGIA